MSVCLSLCLSVGNARGRIFVRESRINEHTDYNETLYNCSIHV